MTATDIKQLAADLGFALCGIAEARPSEHAEHVREWIAAGQHGTMDYLARNLEPRLDPRHILEGVRSVICVADYFGPESPATGGGREGAVSHENQAPPTGHVARYAQFDDYHRTIKKRLHRLADALAERAPGERFRACVDTAPVLEREHAARAGLGWLGKNTLLIHPALGSYMLLGTIVTTLDIAPASPAPPLVPPADHCGSCTRCIDACPTQCIENPDDTGRRSLDATRCISYLTIEHRDVIDASLHEAMGDWVAGCDVCQEVCPFNQRHEGPEARRHEAHPGDPRHVPAMMDPRYAPREHLAHGVPLIDILNWTEDDRRAAFKGSAFKRIKLAMLKRNALIAAGNALRERDDDVLRRRIEELAADESEPALVRETAQQVLRRLHGR